MAVYHLMPVSQLQFGLLCLMVCTQNYQGPGRKTPGFYLDESKKGKEDFTLETPLSHAAEAEEGGEIKNGSLGMKAGGWPGKCGPMCEAGRGRRLTDWYSKTREESGIASIGVWSFREVQLEGDKLQFVF